MYVPILKGRMYETKLLNEYQYFFSDSIIPLIEIIRLKIGKRFFNIEELLEMYDSIMEKYYFVDFFAFDPKKYSGFDPKQVEFALSLRTDSIKYRDTLLAAANSTKGIPVISIKKAREYLLDEVEISNIICELQSKSFKIAVRIESELFEKYIDIIHPLLRSEDYLFYDINESTIESNILDLDIIGELDASYNIILLNSPRPRKLNNGAYPDGDFTKIINNRAKEEYSHYGFDGFGDYAGLKDELPTSGSNGEGYALAVLYLEARNQFFMIKNDNKEEGIQGYHYVLRWVMDVHYDFLNKSRKCPAFEIMEDLYNNHKTGAWATWKYITMVRYISQIKTAYSSYL